MGPAGSGVMAPTDRRTDYRVTFVVLCVGRRARSRCCSRWSTPCCRRSRPRSTPTRPRSPGCSRRTCSPRRSSPRSSAASATRSARSGCSSSRCARWPSARCSPRSPRSIGVLIAARAIQGIGGGVLPLTFGIIRDEFPRDKVAGAIGTSAALLAVGGGFGLVLAGPIVERAELPLAVLAPDDHDARWPPRPRTCSCPSRPSARRAGSTSPARC